MSNHRRNHRSAVEYWLAQLQQFRPKLINLALILILAGAIAGFWITEHTTPARIGSLAFLFLVSLYSYLNNRHDVLGASAFFFGLLDITQYINYLVLPSWLGLLLAVILIVFVWSVLFGKEGWYLSLASSLVATEIALALQYVNIEPKLQVLLIATPFIIACQHYFFHLLQESNNS